MKRRNEKTVQRGTIQWVKPGSGVYTCSFIYVFNEFAKLNQF